MRATKKEAEALNECFKRLYENSEPKGDWEELKLRKDDFFTEYEIDYELMDQILYSVVEEYKIKPRNRVNSFMTTIYLGSSPKYIEKNIVDK